MAASPKKITANRQNASRSTGPSTTAGKAKSSRNALKHGILSKHLLVEGEDPAEYQALLQGLMDDEQPRTTLEMLQVEQIAQCFWRRSRLVQAESAAIALHRAANDTRIMLNEVVGIGESVKFKDEHLEPMDDQDLRHYATCLNIFDEMHTLKGYPEDEVELKKTTPVYHSYLVQQAQKQGVGLYRYLMLRTRLAEDQFAVSIKHCIAEDKKVFAEKILAYEKREKITFLRERHQEMKAIPLETELYARYQAANDNSLEKAVRSLRQSQALRLMVIEGEAEVVKEEK
jgi:hypothetical protein